MKSKIKTWSIGEGQWKMHIPNWEIYKVIRDTLKLKKDNKLNLASSVGENLAKLAVKKDIKKIYLDRGKLRYTGRLKKLCESARSHGLEF